MATKAKKPPVDVAQVVTDKILASLDAGTVPWQRPWAVTGYPSNLDTGNEYRGINIWLLSLARWEKEYDSPYWATYAQAKKASGYTYEKAEGQKRGRYVYAFAKGKQACGLMLDDDGKAVRDLTKLFTIETAHRDGTLVDVDGIEWDPDSYTDPGYGVRSGEKGTHIIFWKPVETVRRDSEGHIMIGADGEPMRKRSFMMRLYSVFNTDQIHLPPGAVPEQVPLSAHAEDDVTAFADQCVESYCEDLGGPDIRVGGERAYYDRKSDHVQMPPKETFHTIEGYNATRFHELVHSTGHTDRLNRDGFDADTSMDLNSYSNEELVAEMGASMLVAYCGLELDVANSAAYIDTWRKRISEDKNLIVKAAQRAQKASDHILGVGFDETE